jgi:cholesterol transport system auxiliary component
MNRRVALLALLATAALPGCTVLGRDRPGPTYFVLRDSAEVVPAAQRSARTLLVAPTATSPFYDTQSMVFSREPGTRAYYQFAAWTERPGRRFDALLLARLERRAAFASVASTTAGVRGDLLLALSLVELYHDDRNAPGQVRIEVSAELTDRTDRRLLGRRTFAQEAAVERDNAEGAVRAFETAVSKLLDDLTPWVEREAR